MIEAAVGKFSLFNEVELEGSNIFRGCAVEWFIDKVGKPCRVKGVSVDGPGSHIADFEVLGKANSEWTRASFVRRHVVDSMEQEN